MPPPKKNKKHAKPFGQHLINLTPWPVFYLPQREGRGENRRAKRKDHRRRVERERVERNLFTDQRRVFACQVQPGKGFWANSLRPPLNLSPAAQTQSCVLCVTRSCVCPISSWIPGRIWRGGGQENGGSEAALSRLRQG